MFLYTFSGTTVLLGLSVACLALIALTYLLRYRLHRASPTPQDGRTKLAGADLQGYSRTIGGGALSFALLASFLVINWTQYQEAPIYVSGPLETDELIEQIPITYQLPKPPPPPPPPPVIEPIANEQAPTAEQMDRSISEADPVVFDLAPRPVLERKAPPPPPVAPPPPPVDEGPVLFAERMPVFGEDCKQLSGEERKTCSDRALLSFIMAHISYPAPARNNGIEGTVYIKFVVEKDGTVTGIEAIRGLPGGLTDAALRAVQRINVAGRTFSPGIQAGRPVRVAFNLPVKFQLD